MSTSVPGAGLARAFSSGVAAAVLLVSAALAGCSGPERAPTPTGSSSAPSPTAVSPSWEDKYDDAELEFYREAVQRADAYETKAQPVWAAGKATQAAKELFQDNLLTWRVAWARLNTYEQQEIRIARAPKVLSAEAETVKLLDGGAGEAKILRCVDATDLGGTANGEPLQEGTTEPVLQQITAVRDTAGAWLFSDFDTTDKPCPR